MAEKEKTAKNSFWKSVKSEFLKITWPDREAIVKQTTMVVFISLVLGIIIAILDFFLQMGVDFITTLNV
ncbi:MAG: preprotein translocase subunit SecE [Lachnospiraceae bacterium]|nr:preprotein translocase subunit SecE [Lachnospiraceae bacterium]